mmetsp:Transcript_103464/g.183496  ORF Transcript_103464/g.183496 Transcript_103464/m.183496 type:complete len:955 (+) Transcript_103464:115-2979(+)
MAVGYSAPMSEGVAATLLAHREAAAAAAALAAQQLGAGLAVLGSTVEVTAAAEREAWRLPDELFLVGLLAVACGDGARRSDLKRSCFQAFRSNEEDAATFMQRWWRGAQAAALRSKQGMPAASPCFTESQLLELVSEPAPIEVAVADRTAEKLATTPPALPVCMSADPAMEAAASADFKLERPLEPRETEIAAAAPPLVNVMELTHLETSAATPASPLQPALSTPVAAASVATASPLTAVLSLQRATEPTAEEAVVAAPASPPPAALSTPVAEAVPTRAEAPPVQLSLERTALPRPEQLSLERRAEPRPEEVAVAVAAPPEAAEDAAVATTAFLLHAAQPKAAAQLERTIDPGSGRTTPRGSSTPRRSPRGEICASVRSRAPRPPAIVTADASDRPPSSGAVGSTAAAGGQAGGASVASKPAATTGFVTPTRRERFDGFAGGLASPAASNSPSSESRCHGVRGDNPYRRKWNPKLAAAQRRERETAERMRKLEEAQQHKASKPSLAGLLTAEADAAEEAEAAAVEAEAAQVAAEAAACAERAAAAAAEAAPDRVEDSRRPLPARACPVPAEKVGRVGAGSAATAAPLTPRKRAPDDPHAMEYGSACAGLSLCAPQDRGPEHRPGSREMRKLLQKNSEMRGIEEPLGEMLGYPVEGPASHAPPLPPSTRRVGAAAPSPGRRSTPPRGGLHGETNGEDMDFNQLQQLISRGLACAEAGEEPDLEVDRAAADVGTTGTNAAGACIGASHRTPSFSAPAPPARSTVAAAAAPRERAVQEVEAEATLRAEVSTPRRAMAEIRAAAERRAYRNRADMSAAGDFGTELGGEPTEDPNLAAVAAAQAESRRNMSAIRAIAERRARGATPRGVTPGRSTDRSMPTRTTPSFSGEELGDQSPAKGIAAAASDAPEPQPPRTPRSIAAGGGAYRPNHVYSGRGAASAGGLSETLGLRFGQPPPGR